MRFKVDENLPDELAQAFRAAGWDCLSVTDQSLGGADDPRVAQVCLDENRILVTFDRGFADIRSFRPDAHAGFIVFRLRDQSKLRVLAVAERLIDWLRQRELHNELWIVEEDRIRIRGGAGPDSLILTRSE